MKQILSAILILLMLSSQATMAFDSINIIPDHHHSASSQKAPSDHDTHDGDHCCHSAAHFVGLAASISAYQSVTESNSDMHAEFSFISQPKLPPTPPPIV